MDFWTKPVCIRLRVSTVLILLLGVVLVITGVVLYKSYAFHNLFFRSLSLDKVESICVYDEYRRSTAVLSESEAEAVISLLRNMRIKEEPYSNYQLMGDRGDDFHIQLKNGISFDLNLSSGDPGVYIFNNDKAYSVGHRGNSDAAENFENLRQLETLYDTYLEKYFPDP